MTINLKQTSNLIITIIYKTVKYISIIILASIIIFLSISFLDTDIANGVTKEKLSMLELGMPEEKLVEILGKPLEKVNYEKDYKGISTTIYVYAKSSLEINIAVDNKKLARVETEFHDISFYLCRSNTCPKIISPFLWKFLIPN